MPTFIFSSSARLRLLALLCLSLAMSTGASGTAQFLDFPVSPVASSVAKTLTFDLRSAAGLVARARLDDGLLHLSLPAQLSGPALSLQQLLGVFGTCQSTLSTQPSGAGLIPTDFEVLPEASEASKNQGADGSANREEAPDAAPVDEPTPLAFRLVQSGVENTRIFPVYTSQASAVTGTVNCSGRGNATVFIVNAAFKPGWNLLRLSASSAVFTSVNVDAAATGAISLEGRLQ